MLKLKNRQRRRPAQFSKSKLATNERGFSLIETTIALLISMIVGLGSAAIFGFSAKNNSGASERTLAAAVAQHELEKIRSVPTFTDTSLAVTAGVNTTVASAGRNYTVNKVVCITAACGGNATLKVITITVTPQGGQAGWMRSPVILRTQRSSLTKGTN
ncbi:MAG: prepilin-type N-terminal cleavage/methylation domain-containing protein [Pyrinomonadaceae bacterium]|nr:prepilin-type N-terminal cleavage/methylation domain-containing protein [Pyrinomonadaceae bacterium]